MSLRNVVILSVWELPRSVLAYTEILDDLGPFRHVSLDRFESEL